MSKIKFAYSKVPNMGDLLNENIMTNVFGAKFIHEPSVFKCNITGIGSFLSFLFQNKDSSKIKTILKKTAFECFTAPCFTWGTGMLDKCENSKNGLARKNVEFVCVRGNLTKKEIEKIINKKINPVFGDGGILASYLFDSPPKKIYKVGLIPHFREHDTLKVDYFKKIYPELHIINLQNDPISVVREIAECEIIISSSLHGLIVADSFNIPNIRIHMTDLPLGTGFKFDDYYSAYDIVNPAKKINSIDDVPSINEIIDNYHITFDMVESMKKNMYTSMKYILNKL